jgi:hypothetical protein
MDLKLHNVYSSPNIIRMIKSRRMRWAGRGARMGENRNAYRVLVGKLLVEGKRLLGRPRSRREINIKMDARIIGWGVTDWIHLPQNRDQLRALVDMVINLRAV